MQIVITFDTTGSMYPCLAEVRRKVNDVVDQLFGEIPNLEMYIITHGDYCDHPHMIAETGAFSRDKNELKSFIRSAPATNGGDHAEFYELILEKINGISWSHDKRVLIMIGDAIPHEVGYRYKGFTTTQDWRREAAKLAEIDTFFVQCLNHAGSAKFWQGMADYAGGTKLDLYQLANIIQAIFAIVYKVEDRLEAYQEQLEANGLFNRGLAHLFTQLGSTKRVHFGEATDLVEVNPSRFQAFRIDHDQGIKAFITDMGIDFNIGRGFYQWTKKETIQERKEVILRDKISGDLFSGKAARDMIGLPFGNRARLDPTDNSKYDMFIQSTSWNRILKSDTDFLYEVKHI